MKKFIVSLTILIIFVAYSFYIHKQPVDTKVVNSTPTDTTNQTTSSSNSAATSSYKDGSYTGDVADAFYGNIQVKATISGGKLTDVEFLQYPNDQHESREINQRAMPLLRQEAITAQSANVDIVSRATDSSNAFVQSLSSALKQAQS